MLRTRVIRRAALVLGAGVGLTVPAAASADDAGVFAAWTQDNAQYRSLAEDLARGQARFEHSGFIRTGLLVQSARRTAALVHKTKARLDGEQPSTDLGAKAKHEAMESLDSLRNSMVSVRRAIRAFKRFDGYDYIRLNRKSRRQRRWAARHRTQARELFKRAGVSGAED